MSRKENMILDLQLPVIIFREGKYFISYCPFLDLSTAGENFEEAKYNFEEIVEIFFEEIIEMGTMEKVLANLGWEKKKKNGFRLKLFHTILNLLE